MPAGPSSPTPAAGDLGRRWATRRALAQEATLAQVMPAMARHGVPALVIKGTVTARLIGMPPGERPSADLDLMVAESSLAAAGAVLGSLGFRRVLDGVPASRVPASHAENWTRGEPFSVWIDLHHTLPRTENPEALFAALTREARTLRRGPTEIRIPSDAGSAMILVLHAAQHAHASGRTLDELERAIAVLPEATWRAAAELAEEVGLMGAFAFALRLAPSGAELAERLGARGDGTFRDRLRASGSSLDGPLWLDRLRRAPDMRAAALVAYNALLPSPAVVRAGHPELGAGRVRLAAYYLRRLSRIPRSFIHYARVRDLGSR